MDDSRILDEVYKRLIEGKKSGLKEYGTLASYIEQEWQREDEKKDYPKTVPSFSKSWYIDAREMERHRGLEIGEDGTVKDIN